MQFFILLGALIHLAVAAEDAPTPFGDFPVVGGLQRTDTTFVDGLGLDLFSPQPRIITITQNFKPSAAADFVTAKDPSLANLGSGLWVPLANYSYVIKFNESNVNDLIGKLEAPYALADLNKAGVSEDNTFLAQFDASRAGWVVDTTTANVHRVENRTRLIQMTSMAGEFRLVGRLIDGPDSQNTFIQSASSVKEARFNITAPTAGTAGETDPAKAPVQIGSWIDGFQMLVRSTKALTINMDFVTADKFKLDAGLTAVNPYGYIVNSSDPTAQVQVNVRLPFQQSVLDAQSLTVQDLAVARLDTKTGLFKALKSDASLTSNLAGFGFIKNNAALGPLETSVDGMWILVSTKGGKGGAGAAGGAAGGVAGGVATGGKACNTGAGSASASQTATSAKMVHTATVPAKAASSSSATAAASATSATMMHNTKPARKLRLRKVMKRNA